MAIPPLRNKRYAGKPRFRSEDPFLYNLIKITSTLSHVVTLPSYNQISVFFGAFADGLDSFARSPIFYTIYLSCGNIVIPPVSYFKYTYGIYRILQSKEFQGDQRPDPECRGVGLLAGRPSKRPRETAL